MSSWWEMITSLLEELTLILYVELYKKFILGWSKVMAPTFLRMQFQLLAKRIASLWSKRRGKKCMQFKILKSSIKTVHSINRYLTAKKTIVTVDGKVDNNPEEGPLSIPMTSSTATLEVKLTGDYISLVSDANVTLSCKDANFTGVSKEGESESFVFEDVVPKTGEECKLAISEVG